MMCLVLSGPFARKSRSASVRLLPPSGKPQVQTADLSYGPRRYVPTNSLRRLRPLQQVAGAGLRHYLFETLGFSNGDLSAFWPLPASIAPLRRLFRWGALGLTDI